ncbi:MAG: hypothetical protein PHS92_04850 [Candidatus Gracilibacteria bacterium]|nr:hypothetical protein [Candidatus Gracilibacteria bacterium]
MSRTKTETRTCSSCNGQGYHSNNEGQHWEDQSCYSDDYSGCSSCGGGGRKYTDHGANIWSSKHVNDDFKKGSGKEEVTYVFRDGDWHYDGTGPSSGGCFVTTAVCEILGKADDCDELQTLRHLRDHYVLNLPEGKTLFEDYRVLSEGIISDIHDSEDPVKAAKKIYSELLPIIDLTKQEFYSEATDKYKKLIRNLSEESEKTKRRNDMRTKINNLVTPENAEEMKKSFCTLIDAGMIIVKAARSFESFIQSLKTKKVSSDIRS